MATIATIGIRTNKVTISHNISQVEQMKINLVEGFQETMAKDERSLEAEEEDTTTTLNQYVMFVAKLVILLLIAITCLITTTWVHLQMQAKATNSLFFWQFLTLSMILLGMLVMELLLMSPMMWET